MNHTRQEVQDANPCLHRRGADVVREHGLSGHPETVKWIPNGFLTGSVTLMDAIPNGEPVNVYSSASVFAFPAYQDASPKVVLEAMSCLKLFVAYQSGRAAELVEGWEERST